MNNKYNDELDITKNDIEDKYAEKTTDLLKVLISTFVITFGTSLLIYYFFSFEITVIYCISLGVTLISVGLVGLENVIIRKELNE